MSAKRIAPVSAAILGLALSACSGGGGGDSGGSAAPPPASPGSPPPPPPVTTNIDTSEKASVFLSRASFGGDERGIDNLNGSRAEDWLNSEFNRATTLYLPSLRGIRDAGGDIDRRAHATAFWDAAINGNDQLRQRTVFALSQIFVVSDGNMNEPLRMAHYMDALSSNAFGNYRDIMRDVTYTPAMADYLTYLRNRKGDERTGRQPDENYAREFVQLFTLGLVELNMDGTPVIGSNGEPVEIYSNDDIVGLARVFTGLSLKGTGFWDEDPDGDYSDLQMYDEQHSELEKTFLGLTIPAGTGGDESIDRAIDHVFNHPNLAPFVSRQLIQRFTTSHPDPAYVERVARAFESGTYQAPNRSFGRGERGDMRATLAAILLDPMFFDGTVDNDPAFGKIREPVLRFAHYARAFDMGNVISSNENFLRDTSSPTTRLGQQPYRAPSVFNFYRPGYVAPSTETGARGLNAPELQIVNEGSMVGYTNFMTDYVMNRTSQRDSDLDSFVPDYSDELALVDDPAALVDHLDTLLMAGRMSDVTRDRMVQVISAIPIRDNTPENTEADRLTRVEVAVTMAVTSPGFVVQR